MERNKNAINTSIHNQVVIPIYDSEAFIKELCGRIIKQLEMITHDFVVIMVEDCSGDLSWQLINEIAKKGLSGYGHSIYQKLWSVLLDNCRPGLKKWRLGRMKRW